VEPDQAGRLVEATDPVGVVAVDVERARLKEHHILLLGGDDSLALRPGPDDVGHGGPARARPTIRGLHSFTV